MSDAANTPPAKPERTGVAFSLGKAKGVATKQDQGTRVDLVSEANDPLTFMNKDGVEEQMFVMVAGTFSTTYRNAERKLRDRALKRRASVLTSDTLDEQQLALIVACVLSWNLADGDKPLPLTRENVTMVLQDAPWLRNQIEAAMADAARFS